MKIAQIDLYLKDYKPCLGRCNHIKTEMSVIERQIEIEKRDMAETLASPKPKPLSDMPRGTQISNPTEKYGGMLADGYKSEELIRLESRLAELQAEYDEKIVVVDYVRSWMSGLTEREKAVVKANAIDELSWKETVNEYKRQFGESVSKDTLKRLKDKAMDKIIEMVK